MADVLQVQQIRGTTEVLSNFTGKPGTLAVDLSKKTLTVHDGATAGGTPLAKEGIKLKTDTDALFQFNGAAEATHASDITITADKAKFAEVIADEIVKDGELAKKLAPELISTDTDSLAKIGSDGLITVPVNNTDKVLFKDDDGKLSTALSGEYEIATGKFILKGGASGTTEIFSVTIPTALTLLKTAELVTNPEGQPAGTYLHFVFDLQSGQESEVYINVTSLIDIYTAGDGILVANNVISVKLAATGNQASIDGDGALIVPTDYGVLE